MTVSVHICIGSKRTSQYDEKNAFYVKIYLNESDREMYSVLMAEIGINLPTVVKYILVGKIEIRDFIFCGYLVMRKEKVCQKRMKQSKSESIAITDFYPSI